MGIVAALIGRRSSVMRKFAGAGWVPEMGRCPGGILLFHDESKLDQSISISVKKFSLVIQSIAELLR